MISAEEASACILAHVQHMPTEEIPLEWAGGRVAARDIHAAHTHPPWRNASMDGYAVRAADLMHLPVTLRVVDHVPAGRFPARDITSGEASQVMTGAPLPESADTVIRIEDTNRGTEVIEIRDDRDRHKNVRQGGEDFRTGDALVQAGDEITPAAMGVLASAGSGTLHVHRRPTVAIVGSGDELVMLNEFDAVRAGRRIVSSNSYTLPALVRGAGGVPRDVGVAADTREALRAKIVAARGCDLLITSAGISVGDHDYTRDVLHSVGADVKFWRVRIRPGAPLAFGTIDGTPWIGLSGNPVSAMVTFELFVRPALRKMLGYRTLFPVPLTATLEEPVTTAAALTHFLRAIVTPSGTGYTARLTGTQSSAALTSMVRANALLILPHERQRYAAGEHVTAIPLGRSLYHTDHFPA